ncbi:MAG: SIS domain-containing protein [Anaerocolumna sp.]
MKTIIYYGDAYEYVLETPVVLEEILEKYKEIFRESIDLLDDVDIQRLYLVGSGSSYHSALAAAPLIEKMLGMPAIAMCPTEFIENIEKIEGHNTLMIGISQQGTSIAVINALDLMRKIGGLTIACTGEHDTEITRHGQGTLYVECGIEDAGSTTKGYTATIVTLELLGLEIATLQKKASIKERDSYIKKMQDMVQKVQSNIRHFSPWCEEQSMKLSECRDVIILASGRCKVLIPEFVLKFSETCRIPVRGFEAEEFMHGMYNAVTDNTQFICLFDGNSQEDDRLKRLVEYYKTKKNHLYCINNPLDYETNEWHTYDNRFSMLEYILLLQILFIFTSRRRGIDLNIPKDPDFHKYMQSKIE